MFSPDSPANRALFRAIAARDVRAARAALDAGADVNAARGTGPSGNPTCSALMKAVEVGTTGDPAMVSLLLEHGAPMFAIPHGHGRLPLREALAAAREPVVAQFVVHAGGEMAFVEQLVHHGKAHLLLDALVGYGLSKGGLLASLFFRVLDATPRDRWLQPRVSWMPWPWSEMERLPALPEGVRQALEARTPWPGPDTVGFEAWSHWVGAAFQAGQCPGWLPRMLADTPANWWIRPLPLGPDNRSPRAHTLLACAARAGNLRALRAGFAALDTLPGPDKSDFLASHAASVLRAAAARANPRALRAVIEHLPANLARPHLDEGLLLVSLEDHDTGLRARAVRQLLAVGARPVATDSKGDGPLHHLARWRPVGGHRDALLEGFVPADLDMPNARGQTPLDMLELNDPSAAARLRHQRLHVALAAAGPASIQQRPRL